MVSSQYPGSLDNLINPTATDKMNSATVPHHEQHANANDAIEAVQTVLGTNPAGSHLTVKDRIISAEENITAQSVLNGMTDVTITSIASGDVLRFDGTTWQNYHETDIVDGGNF